MVSVALPELTERLTSGKHLLSEEAESAARILVDREVKAEEKANFLRAFSKKGETIGEVTAFARVFRSLSRDPEVAEIAEVGIDVVGTGGSGSGGFNISSCSAMIVAAAGIPVLKHGNRAITSSSGAADFLGTLGVPLNPSPEIIKKSLKELNFCFFFAPEYHPAFKEIMPIRKALAEEGQRTIFNILGPLINPAQPVYQLLGVFSAHWVGLLATSMHELGLKRGVAVHGILGYGRGMDELITAGDNKVAGFGQFKNLSTIWQPDELGFQPCPESELLGASAVENVAELKRIMCGKGRNGLVDTIVLNSGVALWIAGGSPDVKDGMLQARDIILGGRLAEWLEKMQAFYRMYSGDS